MQIKNISAKQRTLSIGGINVPLYPGATYETDLTKDEAKAFEQLGFEVAGEPVKPTPKGKE
jgi:hypothetical protein